MAKKPPGRPAGTATSGLCWSCGKPLATPTRATRCPCGKWSTNRVRWINNKAFLIRRRAPNKNQNSEVKP